MVQICLNGKGSSDITLYIAFPQEIAKAPLSDKSIARRIDDLSVDMTV